MAYLNVPLYMAGSGRWGTYVIWDKAAHLGGPGAVCAALTRVNAPDGALVAANYELPPPLPEPGCAGWTLRLRRRFSPAVNQDEELYLYEAQRS